MKKLWKVIDGNKTIIGLVLLNITQLTFMKDLLGPDIVPIRAIISAFTGYGAYKHIRKGKLSKKNN